MVSVPAPPSAAPPAPLPQRRTNMKVTLVHRLEFAAAWVLLKFFRVIGVDAASFIAGKSLRFLGPCLRKISRRGEVNLARVYPHWSQREIRSTIADVWENLGRVGGEFVHISRFGVSREAALAQVRSAHGAGDHGLPKNGAPARSPRITFEASEASLAVLARGKPIIFVTGHFANWEVMGMVCAFVDTPFAFIYRAANNPLIDEMIIRIRSQSMPHLQIPKGPEGAREFIDALKEKRSFGMLVDQKFTDGIRVPFLGHEAMTAPTPARIALNYKFPLIPVTMRRTKGAHFVCTLHDEIKPEPTGDLHHDIRVLTIRINQVLEKTITNNPGQWLWLHRRWGPI